MQSFLTIAIYLWGCDILMKTCERRTVMQPILTMAIYLWGIILLVCQYSTLDLLKWANIMTFSLFMIAYLLSKNIPLYGKIILLLLNLLFLNHLFNTEENFWFPFIVGYSIVMIQLLYCIHFIWKKIKKKISHN